MQKKLKYNKTKYVENLKQACYNKNIKECNFYWHARNEDK